MATQDDTSQESRALPMLGIVDRDRAFLTVLGRRVEDAGWRWEPVPPPIQPDALAQRQLDAVVVDLALVGSRPWSWLNAICRLRPDLPIIVCTAASTVAQRVYGLSIGADDWLAKPCHPEELLARVEAVTDDRSRRRSRKFQARTVGELEIIPDRYQAFVEGRSVELTQREYQLLEYLVLAGGEVAEREHIYAALWRRGNDGTVRSVDVCIHKLRRKLELASPGWRYIRTHYGVGYRLLAERVGRAAHRDGWGEEEPPETVAA